MEHNNNFLNEFLDEPVITMPEKTTPVGNLEFIDTLDSEQFGNFTIVLQEYTDENDQSIYHVSVEFTFNNGCYTNTLDIYETIHLDKAETYYSQLVNNIKLTNTINLGD